MNIIIAIIVSVLVIGPSATLDSVTDQVSNMAIFSSSEEPAPVSTTTIDAVVLPSPSPAPSPSIESTPSASPSPKPKPEPNPDVPNTFILKLEESKTIQFKDEEEGDAYTNALNARKNKE